MATQRRIGATIQLDGEKQFRSAVTQATSALKTMRSEMKLVDTQFAGQANTLEALTKKHEVLEKTLEQTRKVESETAEALANAQKNYANAGDSLSKYRDALEKSQKELEALKESGTATDEVIEEQEKKVSELARAVTSGEKAYDQAGQNVETWAQKLNTAKTDVINLSRELEENDRYMQEAASSADGVASSIDGFGKKIKENTKEASDGVEEFANHVDTFFTADKIAEYANAVSAQFEQIATSAYRSAQEIDKGYDAIIQKTGATGERLAGMTASADNLYAQLPVEMNKVGDAIGEVSTRWHLQGEELENVAETALKFAELNRTDVVQSVDSAQNMMSAFGESIENIGTAYDVMNKVGQDTGVNLSTISSKVTENAAAFQELGLDMYQSIAFMGQLETSGADASTVLSGMKRALKSATEEGKSFDEALAEMEDRILYGTDSMDGLNAAYDLFGKSGAGIYTALKSGSLSFRDLANSQQLVADSADSVARTYEATLDPWDEMTRAAHGLQTAGADLAGEVLSDLAPAITALAGGITDLRKGFEKLPAPVRKLIAWGSTAGVTLGVIVPKVLALQKGLSALKAAGGVSKQLDDISDAMSALTGAGKAAEAVDDVAEAVDGLTDAAKAADTVGDVAEAIDDISDAAKGAGGIGELAGDIGELATAGGGASGMFSSLAGSIGSALPFIGGIAAIAGGSIVALEAISDRAMAADESFQQFITDMDDMESRLDSSMSTLKTTFDESTASIDSIFTRKSTADSLISELTVLQNKSSLTDDELARMHTLVGQVNALFPELGWSVNDVTGKIEANGRAISNVRDSYNGLLTEAMNSAYYNALADQFTALTIAEKEASDAADLLAERQQERDRWLEERQNQTRIGGDVMIAGMRANFNALTVTEHKELARMDAEIEELTKSEEEHTKTLDSKREAYNALTEKGIDGYLESLGIATDKTDANTQAVEKATDNYQALAKKIQETGSVLTAEDFTEEEAEIQALYENTVQAWQSYHDTFTAGMADEVKTLSGAMTKWSDYRDSVRDALKGNQGIFNEVTHNDQTTWEAMTAGLESNVQAYEDWNRNVESILSSSRYQTDEVFREMANSIMLLGTSGSDYLQQFVDNVDMEVDRGLGDLGRFADLSGLQDEYAINMANLQMATETGMDGIATAFDDTASEAQISLQSLSDSIASQADAYMRWYENVQTLTNSDRYASDASFREFANNVLSYGTAGADMLDTIVQSMSDGSTELDDAITEYMSLKGANEKAAQAEASIQATLSDGFDNQIQLVDNAQDQLATAYGNYADAGVAGFSERINLLGGIMDGSLSEAELAIANGQEGMTQATQEMTDAMTQAVTDGTSEMLASATLLMSSFIGESFGMGSQAGRSFAAGIASSLRSQGSNAYVSPGQTATTPAGNATNISMTVNGTEGQDVRTLADIVLDRISSAVASTGAAYGY